jgi:hypothetical protein
VRDDPRAGRLTEPRARVQYELTQHPKLLGQLPGDLVDLLTTALESSRYALALKQDNADIFLWVDFLFSIPSSTCVPPPRYLPYRILHLPYLLSGLHHPCGTHTDPRSNTAQVLTSLVEATTEPRSNHSPDVLSLLEEALGLFQRCLALQEYQYTESQSQAAAMSNDASMDDSDLPDAEDGSVSLTSEEPQDDRWATILEPITNSTLLDTLLAQVETLTLVCNLIPASSEPNLLSFITEYSSNLLSQ